MRSGAGRSVRKPRLVGTGPSGTGSDTGPPGEADPRPGRCRRTGRGEAGTQALGGEVGELSCDPRCMTGPGPTSQRPHSPDGRRRGGRRAERRPRWRRPAVERANRLNAANMVRSLLPLVRDLPGCIVGWTAFRQSEDAGRAHGRPVAAPCSWRRRGPATRCSCPTGLGEDYRSTSARTDAGNAGEGDPVTLEIGYLTPGGGVRRLRRQRRRRAPTRSRRVLDGARGAGHGRRRRRAVDPLDHRARTRPPCPGEDGGVIVVVTGSASDEELREVAAAVRRRWTG